MKKYYKIYIFLLLIFVLGGCKNKSELKYEEAKQMLNVQNFNGAKAAFIELGDYNDSSEMVKECDYQKGCKYIDDERFEKALETLKPIKGYSDVNEKLNECHYYLGENLYNEGKYSEAIEEYKSSNNFKDSSDKIKKANDKIKVQNLEKMQWAVEAQINSLNNQLRQIGR